MQPQVHIHNVSAGYSTKAITLKFLFTELEIIIVHME